MPTLPQTPAPSGTSNKLRKPSHRRVQSSLTPESSRDCSLQQVWAEDYYTDDYWQTDSTIKPPSPPPAATLTSRPFPRSIPLSADEESHPARQTRTHQRSLTALLPFRNSRPSSTSPQRSPIKEISTKEFEDEFMPTLTGDRDGVIKVADKTPRGLASWFSGSSAPVQLGMPMMDSKAQVESASPENQPSKLQRRPTLSNIEPAGSTAASNSMFNFFSSPKTPSKNQIVQLPSELNSDEFLTLDITNALFPSMSPSDRDPFSPAAFKNLLMNAEGLLLRLQTAYKLRTLSLHELSAEKEAMTEELEEAETRASCLRSQLEDMAARVSSQEATINELARELALEKQARAEEREAREKSISLIRSASHKKHASLDDIPTEDLGISRPRRERRKWRTSTGSTDLSCDGESDNESGGAESVFSRSRSPTFTLNSSSASMAPSLESTPEIGHASFGRMVPNPSFAGTLRNEPTDRPKLVQQKSTFHRMLKGMAPLPAEANEDPYQGIGMGEDGCGNCRGKDASVAWDTVGLLRVENKGLKERVGELEIVVDGALDMCYGVKV